MSADGAAEPTGTLAEEAARLVDVLAGWAEGHGASGASDPAVEGTTCQWCPLCRVVHAVTHLSPEVRQHLTTAYDSLVQAAASLLDTRPDAGPDAGPDAEPREGDERTP